MRKEDAPANAETYPHRLRCMTTRLGIVNECPECGYRWVTDWTWNSALDPEPAAGPIVIDSEQAISVLAEIGSATGLSCVPSCEEAAASRAANSAT